MELLDGFSFSSWRILVFFFIYKLIIIVEQGNHSVDWWINIGD